MFQARMEMRNLEGSVFRSASRSTMLRYKSDLLHTLATVIFSPLYLYELKHQTQTVTVEMFSQYEDDPVR